MLAEAQVAKVNVLTQEDALDRQSERRRRDALLEVELEERRKRLKLDEVEMEIRRNTKDMMKGMMDLVEVVLDSRK